jgi:hypothetical protein
MGLDLGPPGQATALAAVEQHWSGPPEAHFHVRYLRRWTPGTPYPAIVGDVVKLTADRPLAGAPLAADQTGVGRPVADLLTQAGGTYGLTRVVVTAGHVATVSEDGARLVPKRDLVGVLQVLLQTRRLRIAAELPEASMLERELLEFRAKTPAAGAEVAESWRERPHDDLVLAVALACWLAGREPLYVPSEPVMVGPRGRRLPPLMDGPVVVGGRRW